MRIGYMQCDRCGSTNSPDATLSVAVTKVRVRLPDDVRIRVDLCIWCREALYTWLQTKVAE